ncbi:hypothetical protein Tco_1022635 [Tanacetum coccineum]
MASFDYRLNPLYAIKECSSCGALYTTYYCCSKGSLIDKIIRERPPQNCATCGDSVDGLYCLILMASFDYRLNPLYTIKECSSCGALYTTDYCCSKGGLVDKIIRERPPQNCATCGDPVDGLYCRPCAFVRKCLNEGWYTIHDENEILNTSDSSNDNTNIVSAPQEPFVFNQDPGQNSSQSLPLIDHHCCYECGDSLDDIFS